MEKIIERRLLSTISLGVKKNKKITQLAKDIAQDIKSKLKMVAEGKIKSAEFGFPSRLEIRFRDCPEKVGIQLLEEGKSYRIWVEEI